MSSLSSATPQNLPWLPRPTAADCALLGSDQIGALVAAARLGWNASELAALGRRAIRAGREAASAAGLVPFSLLAVAPHTLSHLVDGLAAAGLRHGLFLDVRTVEHDVSADALEKARGAGDPPDAALVAFERPPASIELGSEEEEAALLGRMRTRLIAEIERVRAALPTTLILETLAGDAGALQTARETWLPGSPRRLIARHNAAIVAEARSRGMLVHDAAALADLAGQAAWHAGRFGALGRYPFAPACGPLWADRLCGLLAARAGRSRRVLVLDLDETLWGGIVGDDGVENIVLGPGSPRGEAHCAIQRAALDIKARGAILAVSSRNDPRIARDAFRLHPEMLIREHDIAAWRISFGDKAQHLGELAAELRLAPSAFVVLDDDPVERKRVRDALTEVAVPELPPDPADWLPVFQAAAYFEDVAFSAEDRGRTEAYRAEAGRAALAAADPDRFLVSLDMTVAAAPFDALSRPRIVQLLAKSNQFNLTGQRYGEAEIAAVEGAPDAVGLVLRVRDMFGDSGLISVAIARADREVLRIEAWVMSCRVLGRRVEEAMLAALAEAARAHGLAALEGVYRPSPRNALVRDHYERLGFSPAGVEADGATRWRLDLAAWTPSRLPYRLELPT